MGPLGPLGRWGCQKYTLGNSPETIIHDADDACGVTLIGAYPRALPEELDAAIQEFPLTRTVPATFDGHYGLQLSMHFSSAPLADVTAAEVFRRGPGPYSRGILLTYGNGGQRALGECRLGVDSSRRYEWPRLLCTTMESKRSEVPPNRRLWTAMVQFKDAQAHEHDGDGWKCYDMSGTLNFWFTHNQQYLEVVLA